MCEPSEEGERAVVADEVVSYIAAAIKMCGTTIHFECDS